MVPKLHAKLLSASHTFTLGEALDDIAEVVDGGLIDDEKRLKKRLLEEFWPLVAIAQCVGDDHTRIVYQGSSTDVDAQLLLRTLPPQPIEFTIAFDAEQEALRDEHLERFGHAPVTAVLPKPSATRASGRREIAETEADVWSRTERQEIQLGWMERALDHKKKLAVKRASYCNAWLGIVVINERLKRAKEFFDPIARRLLADAGTLKPFPRVFVASTVGDYVFDSATMSSRLIGERIEAD